MCMKKHVHCPIKCSRRLLVRRLPIGLSARAIWTRWVYQKTPVVHDTRRASCLSFLLAVIIEKISLIPYYTGVPLRRFYLFIVLCYCYHLNRSQCWNSYYTCIVINIIHEGLFTMYLCIYLQDHACTLSTQRFKWHFQLYKPAIIVIASIPFN